MADQGKKHRWLDKTLNDRYRIEALIASGGTSDVYRAVDLQLEQAGAADCRVALKILKPDMVKQEGMPGILARETAKTRSLSHPNIVRVQDLQKDGDTCFMVMELLEGEPLTRMIQRSRPNGLKWKGVKGIVKQILSALKYAHENNVIHADLKPSNIFFTRKGQIKLLDFGVSQVLNDPLQMDYLNPAQDETSVYGYTPAYTLPELCTDKNPSAKGDIYALTCIIYELLSSKHPFNRSSPSKEQRQSSMPGKPGNMPWKTWVAMKRLLRGDDNVLSVRDLEQAIKPVPWKTATHTMITAAAIAAGVAVWQTGSADSAKADLAIQKLEQEKQHTAALQELPPERLLEHLADISQFERAGLLKLNQNALVSHFLTRIENALEPNERNGLPDIMKALSVISRAAALFPRDAELLRIKHRIEGRQTALQDAIAEEIQSTLKQVSYKDSSSAEALLKLGGNLEFLGGTLPTPSTEATNTFLAQVETAFDRFDARDQARLLTIGNRFFTGIPEAQKQLLALERLAQAAKTLAEYTEKKDSNENSPFPADAALVFYAQKFQGWSEITDKATSSRELDRVYDDIQALKADVPEDFEKIISAEKKLARAYLSHADKLLAKNRTSRAQPLLKRATTLMR